jgi:hypothetical protein
MSIQKCKLILTDFQKSSNDQMSFSADVIFAGPNTDTFVVWINSDSTVSTSFSFSIIVIMTQA